jgi:hypothetical protein
MRDAWRITCPRKATRTRNETAKRRQDGRTDGHKHACMCMHVSTSHLCLGSIGVYFHVVDLPWMCPAIRGHPGGTDASVNCTVKPTTLVYVDVIARMVNA